MTDNADSSTSTINVDGTTMLSSGSKSKKANYENNEDHMHKSKVLKIEPATSSVSKALDSKLTMGTTEALVGERYSTEERLLDEYARLHPMLSMEATSEKTLNLLLGDAVERQDVAICEERLPVIGKTYEDSYLRPAVSGERSCCLEDQCLCNFIARVRYGNGQAKQCFTGAEFLLPEQRRRWLEGGSLPEPQGKCLVCIRYFVTYCYLRLGSDPHLSEALKRGGISMQTHANPKISTLSQDTDGTLRTDDGNALITHCNTVSNTDGYLPQAMLQMDPSFVNQRISRQSSLGHLVWQPFVRFQANTLRYEFDTVANHWRIVQIGVGCDDQHLNDRPSDETIARATAPPNAIRNEKVSTTPA